MSDLCERVRATVQEMRDAGRVAEALGELLTAWSENLRRQVTSYSSYSSYEQELVRPQILASFIDLETVLEAINSDRKTANATVRELLEESLQKVVPPGTRTEVLIVLSVLNFSSLRSAAKLTASELGFILLLSSVTDYAAPPFLPRVVHEAVHGNRDMIQLCENPNIRQKHLGEVMCDSVALILSGPVFLHSMEALMTLVGPGAAQRVTPSHPSMAARASVLESVALRLWSRTKTPQLVAEIMRPIQDVKCAADELVDQEYYRGQALAKLSAYQPLGPGEAVWQEIYAASNYNRQGSILVGMNIDFAQRRAGS